MDVRIAAHLTPRGRAVRSVLALGAALAAAGCQPTTPQLVTVDGATLRVVWTPDELRQDPAVRTLKRTAQASWHLLRAVKPETPHVHPRNDLTVTVLAGHGRLHLGDAVYRLRPGDVVLIPRNTVHWMEPEGGPNVVLLVVTPPLGPHFRKPVANATSTP